MKSTEKNFIRRLKRQKEDAIEFVIDTYMPVVKAVVWKVLGPTDADHEECVSDVFLAVWDHADQFEGDASEFKKWICMVAKYKAIDAYRRAMKRKGREHGMEDLTFIQDRQDVLLVKEEQEELLMAMSQLSEVDRDIFTMKYFLEMSNGEIAESLNVTKASVDNRLYRGKKKLSAVLKNEWKEECV
ncbi:DNA-directed RNA polymerase sigma-70 factor [Sporosarcina sp. NCCP-2716]|uniref:sigma-70 family RNA polymerase sigma factor n=1 Tax=Sporosarcina sp. NCCP-2716 TaxID=2943679 RepID=UPI00203CA766|nr:sigma-70 family RNA polymerase sigma factor [Sporosarcina sp. NCCP-2716]GKV69745.1 DNA-directed RNA polymerase sigma-70 factor [Sporosarcina sp. NCCP-2716]